MTTQTPDAVPVIQADRDAAFSYWLYRGSLKPDDYRAVKWRRELNQGDYDGKEIVQAFARHRLAALDSRASDAGEGDDPDHQYAVVSSNYARPFLAGAYPTLDAALLAQDGKPERWHIYRRMSATPAPAVDAVPAGEVEQRTDAEIVEQTNDLAREFYARRGYKVPGGYRFDRATHPHEVEAWDMACMAMEVLTDTDAQSVADDFDDAALSHGEGRK